MREVAQAAWQQRDALRAAPRRDARNKALAQSMDSFIGRLHWRDHFTQKLEDAPEIELVDLHPGYEGMRDDAPDDPLFTAWAEGRTGLPFVDACMRCLGSTGWMNFRMRAMLQATVTYHLWRHWRSPALLLARLFTDYEPGIHYPQCQMQAGTTGINTVRVYNPVKQGHDQDPEGVFVARWVPELAGLPGPLRQEPWRATPLDLADADLRLGVDYPEPVVDHQAAARFARRAVHERRRSPEFRAIADPARAAFQTSFGLTLAAARAYDIVAIDGVYNDISNAEGLENEVRQGRLLGFDGKTLIHPSQIEIANRIFAPDEADVQQARMRMAYRQAGPEAVSGFRQVLEAMMEPEIRRQFKSFKD